MIPILFAENSTTFTSNGIGRLSDAISCEVTEERNGQYELQMTYPVTGAHFDDITLRALIVAKPFAGGTNQPFRIYNISRPINGRVTINAQHISYDLSKNVTMPFSESASSSACANVFVKLKANAVEACPFTFWTDVTTVASYAQTTPASIRQRLAGIEGSILDQFGGEYEFDGYTVKLHKDRGTTKNIPLRYGKNITDIKQEENISNTITGVVPYWIDMDGENLVVLPEKVVYSPNASSYSQKLTVSYDCSSDFQNKPTEAALRAHAQAYVNQSGVGIPKVSIDVSFVNLADTEEYKDLIPLQQVNLCDVIPVQFESLGIDTTAKIVKTEYDVLGERYNKITVGSLRSNLATAITEQNANMVAETSARFSQVTTEIDNATAWLTNADGYVIAVKNTDGTWKELIFADHQDPSDWVHCLRINENGIGFSSDGGTTYTQAWTLDGRLVIGGTDVPSITVYDSDDNVIFQASATAMIWNAANSSMDADGYITMTGASITGGEIKQTNNTSYLRITDGKIYLGDAYNNVIGELSYLPYNQRDNLLVKSTSGDMMLDANHHDLYMTNVDDLVINNIVGADNSYHVVTDLQYDQYTFATDLSISSDEQGGISWSYTNVTLNVATGADTENFETDKGLFTATW